MEPPFPLHNFLLGAGKLGLTQLANLERLPITGALLVVAPLRLVGGTGSPSRVYAFVPKRLAEHSGQRVPTGAARSGRCAAPEGAPAISACSADPSAARRRRTSTG